MKEIYRVTPFLIIDTKVEIDYDEDRPTTCLDIQQILPTVILLISGVEKCRIQGTKVNRGVSVVNFSLLLLLKFGHSTPLLVPGARLGSLLHPVVVHLTVAADQLHVLDDRLPGVEDLVVRRQEHEEQLALL